MPPRNHTLMTHAANSDGVIVVTVEAEPGRLEVTDPNARHGASVLNATLIVETA